MEEFFEHFLNIVNMKPSFAFTHLSLSCPPSLGRRGRGRDATAGKNVVNVKPSFAKATAGKNVVNVKPSFAKATAGKSALQSIRVISVQSP